MPLDSRLVRSLDQGYELDITLEGLDFRVYIALRDADIEQVASLVSPERFAQDGDVHVVAIHDADDASEQIQDVLFNLNPGDAIVFLCTGKLAYENTLTEFNQLP